MRVTAVINNLIRQTVIGYMQFAKYLNQEKTKKNKFFINNIKRQTALFSVTFRKKFK
jgi:hypothetical protein